MCLWGYIRFSKSKILSNKPSGGEFEIWIQWCQTIYLETCFGHFPDATHLVWPWRSLHTRIFDLNQPNASIFHKIDGIPLHFGVRESISEKTEAMDFRGEKSKKSKFCMIDSNTSVDISQNISFPRRKVTLWDNDLSGNSLQEKWQHNPTRWRGSCFKNLIPIGGRYNPNSGKLYDGFYFPDR